MTFILTELSDLGIIMAADSSETVTDSNCEQFQECNKIIYFPELNIGISTWGDAIVENKGINDWLNEKIKEFKSDKNGSNLKNKYLEDVSNFIAEKLNIAFPKGESVLGLHITGFSRHNSEFRPGIFHVHNHNEKDKQEISNCLTPEHRNGQPKKFFAEKTKPILNIREALHLRNGIYKEFALFFPALQGVKQSFVNIIRSKYGSKIDLSKLDVLKIQAESVANWVRLMCNTFSEAGILPYVGKNVKVLLIQENKYRKFVLNEFSEEKW
jgi:hypothetical protein